MKILYGITKSNFGGAQRYVYELAVEAKRLGHDVKVVCGKTGALTDKLEEAGIPVIPIHSMERDIRLIAEIVSGIEVMKILNKERPDVFHINSSKMGGTGGLAGRLVGAKNIIFTAHGWAFNEPRPGWQKVIIKFFVWLTILLSHKTVCVSKETKKQVSHWPFVENKLVVVHNGIREFDLNPRVDTSFTVGAISELHKIKGLDVLLTAWSKFINKHEAKLVLMGSGEERENLENMAQNLGISGSVIFKGYVDNARSHLLEFDIFCMPSRSENLPYSLLEAGFAGLPVIATAVGGIPEIVRSSVNGALIAPEDPEALYSTLLLFAEDKSLRDRLGATLKASVRENFSFEKMAEKTFALY